jgi:hypothetical protein
MKNPGLKTRVVHSIANSAWNIVNTKFGDKFKIARVPYIVVKDEEVNKLLRAEAFEHAEFISYCFNNAETILKHNI